MNRWQEDWSVLADPSVPRQSLDTLKYIPLGDAKTYLSLGAGLRLRYESNDAPNFGVGDTRSQSYVISRLEAHADLRLSQGVQVFVQLDSAFAPGKARMTPVDQNRLDLEQGFVALVEPVGAGTLRLRAGRQQFAFDLQRFVSLRDGPNVRQSYDALWANYEIGSWRFISFFSHPVQNRDSAAFDDSSNAHLSYGGLRGEYEFGPGSVALYYSQYRRDGAVLGSLKGSERRNIWDLRSAGAVSGWDWDVEGMLQSGHLAEHPINAWAIGSRAGYRFSKAVWQPRLGLQADAASGDKNPNDGKIGSFNPLFPNGYYVALAGYTGYTNFIHLKPSLTLKPRSDVSLMLAGAMQWRQTTADAVYTQPMNPVAGTAGRGSAYTGTYYQARMDWQISGQLSAAVEAVRFSAGEAIRQAGGRPSNYIGVEFKSGW
ncbi:hypothetical protein FHS83_000100 [Rhizomicrobium palustre]|uniref:Alginate export domain-containing protein n=1 Tax=Rhizomicrobium palustre TaxID=189966 RepID=A0A846MUJ0_9PROT|nr:alginate export family protein [Rhizomicrobium palustre]NIK86782.1 hypothetical protein [Rhizomicrobium palustre]